MEAQEALARWGLGEALRPADDGLINRTWLVGDPPVAVLQWVNPIFGPRVHLDIDAVTTRLGQQGLTTTRLLPTVDGERWLEDTTGCWRLLSYVPGRTLHRVESPRHAAAAGALVGRFHAAVADWPYVFQHRRPGAHDTLAHMATLAAALQEHADHPLAAQARPVGEAVLAAWDRWPGSLDQPERVCHGDLKISNLRFDESGQQAISLLDLDTLAHLPLSVEMGDAWRSWCNAAGEDQPEAAALDLERFEASARAWLAAAPPLAPEEREGLVPGLSRIALELSARFCADALRNSYFREDRQRYPQPGAHNLLRATGQLRLAESALRQAGAAEVLLRAAGR